MRFNWISFVITFKDLFTLNFVKNMAIIQKKSLK